MAPLLSHDGLRLHLRRWPATGAARGTVQIVHGLGEHIGRYDELALQLNAAGWHVAGHDHRGHGRSDGARGDIASPHSLLVDLAQVIDRLRGAGAHVLLGHSLGGLIAARFVAEALADTPAAWSRPVGGLVLASPALEPGLRPVQKLLLALLGPLAPSFGVNTGLRPEWVSRDIERLRRYADDVLGHDRITPRLVRFIVDEGRLVRRRAAAWRTPTLLMWSGADRCVSPSGSAAFAAAAPGAIVQTQVFPALYHELFNEPERALVIDHLTRWLARF